NQINRLFRINRTSRSNGCRTIRPRFLPTAPGSVHNRLLLPGKEAPPVSLQPDLLLLFIGKGAEDVFGNVHSGFLLFFLFLRCVFCAYHIPVPYLIQGF
ncbi:MAG: hypothetical protein IJU38_11005, partial [Clostridia bacterium]|nr:hypothetical protein [Clostridia bacterium]